MDVEFLTELLWRSRERKGYRELTQVLVLYANVLFASHRFKNLSIKLGEIGSKVFFKNIFSLLMYLHIYFTIKRLNNVLQVFTKKLTHSSGNAGVPFDHSPFNTLFNFLEVRAIISVDGIIPAFLFV